MSPEPKSLGGPYNRCEAVYGSMPEPTVRTFHAKLLAAGYDISLSGAQRFIARHIKKPQPKLAAVASPLTPEELSLIQKDLAELRPLDAAALKPGREGSPDLQYHADAVLAAQSRPAGDGAKRNGGPGQVRHPAPPAKFRRPRSRSLRRMVG